MDDIKRVQDQLERNGVRVSRRELLRIAGYTGLGLTGLMVLAGCGGGSQPAAAPSGQPTAPAAPAAKPAAGGILKIAMNTDVQQLDPHLVTAHNDRNILGCLFCGLTYLDDKMQPKGDLAESWENPDPTTYIFKLRKGVLFHNGREFKAEDVKFSFERILTLGKRSKWSSLIADIKTVEVQGDYQVKINLSNPSAPFLSHLAYAPIVAKEAEDKLGTQPIGTGPFMFVERVPNAHVKVKKWDKFFAGAPKVDEIQWIPTPESATQVANVKTGAVHMAAFVDMQTVPDLKQSPGLAVVQPKLSSAYAWILINHKDPALGKKGVRQALANLVDRESMNRSIFFGVGEPGVVPFPNDHWVGIKRPTPAYDPARAKKLLQDAGVSGLKLTWKAFNQPYSVKIAEFSKAAYKEAGIDLEIIQMDFAAWIKEVYNDKNFQMAATTMLREYDPDAMISSVVGSQGQNNPGSYNSPTVDQLLVKGRAELDANKRKEIYGQITDLIIEDVPGIKVQSNPYLWAVSSKVKDFSIDSLSLPTLALRTAALGG